MALCPKCHNEVATEYRYCPGCGYQLTTPLDAILLAKQFGEVEARKGIHDRAQTRLWEMGKELSFYSVMEYGIPDLTQEGRRSYIDVIWKSRNGIEFAFEIRRKIHDLNIVTTLKDTNKLQNIVAKKKFVVNVSELTGRAYFNEIMGEPTKKPPKAENPKSASIGWEPLNSKRRAYSSKEIRQKYPRAGLRWTKEEDDDLIRNFQNCLTIPELANKHQRNRGGIRTRLIRLGLIDRT